MSNWIFPSNGIPPGQPTTPGDYLAQCQAYLQNMSRYYGVGLGCDNQTLDISAFNTLMSEMACIIDTACQLGWTGFDPTSKCNIANAFAYIIKNTADKFKWDGIPFDGTYNFPTTDLGPGTLNQDDRVYMRRGGQVVKVPPERLLTDTCLNSLQDVSNFCGDVKRIVLIDTAGCKKLATYSENTSQIGQYGWYPLSGKPQDTSGYTIPGNLPNPNPPYYDFISFRNDHFNNTENTAAINNQRIIRASFTAQCPRTYELDFTAFIIQPATVEEAYDNKSVVVPRFSYDGGLTWNYFLSAADNKIASPLTFNSVMLEYNNSFSLSLNPGNILIELIWFPAVSGVYATLDANTFTGPLILSAHPNLIIRPSIG